MSASHSAPTSLITFERLVFKSKNDCLKFTISVFLKLLQRHLKDRVTDMQVWRWYAKTLSGERERERERPALEKTKHCTSKKWLSVWVLTRYGRDCHSVTWAHSITRAKSFIRLRLLLGFYWFWLTRILRTQRVPSRPCCHSGTAAVSFQTFVCGRVYIVRATYSPRAICGQIALGLFQTLVPGNGRASLSIHPEHVSLTSASVSIAW